MKLKEATYKFRGWVFVFTPFRKRKLRGRIYTMWKVIVEWRGKKYKTYYLAFTPSAFICRFLKKSKSFLNHPITK